MSLKTMSDNKAMRQVCRVLLVLADHGQCTADTIKLHISDMNVKQIQTALSHLCVKQKIRRVRKESPTGQTVYEFNEDFEPDDRPKMVKTRSKLAEGMNRNARDKKGRIPEAVTMTLMFKDRKITLLKGMMDKVAPHERDIIHGIIKDYESLDLKFGLN